MKISYRKKLVLMFLSLTVTNFVISGWPDEYTIKKGLWALISCFVVTLLFYFVKIWEEKEEKKKRDEFQREERE